MFKVGTQRLTWIAVKWTGLDTDGFEVANEIEMQVELVDRLELVNHLNDERRGIIESAEFAQRVSKDWRGVGDADGRSLPYSLPGLELIWEAPGFAAGWGEAYLRAWNGMGKEREKNSKSLPAGGQAQSPKVETP